MGEGLSLCLGIVAAFWANGALAGNPFEKIPFDGDVIKCDSMVNNAIKLSVLYGLSMKGMAEEMLDEARERALTEDRPSEERIKRLDLLQSTNDIVVNNPQLTASEVHDLMKAACERRAVQ